VELIASIDASDVIEKILRHLNLWSKETSPAWAPPEPLIQDYTIEPVLKDCQWFDQAIAG